MGNSGTSGLKIHLKAKHGALFDNKFSQGESDRSKIQFSESSGCTSILNCINPSQSKEKLSFIIVPSVYNTQFSAH